MNNLYYFSNSCTITSKLLKTCIFIHIYFSSFDFFVANKFYMLLKMFSLVFLVKHFITGEKVVTSVHASGTAVSMSNGMHNGGGFDPGVGLPSKRRLSLIFAVKLISFIFSRCSLECRDNGRFFIKINF